MSSALPVLAAAAESLGSPLTAAQIDLFVRFRDLLLDWNQKINVTAIREADAVETLHFVDSLAALPVLPRATGPRVIDVGSGGGLPGLVLRIARPDLSLTLVDSIGKKAMVMTRIVEGLGLDKAPTDGGAPVVVLASRAEDLGQKKGQRETYDAALLRAVADLAVVAELGLPMLRPGGLLVAWKKRDIASEISGAIRAITTLGGRLMDETPVNLVGLPADRQLVVISKERPTPPRFPRSPGTPKKEPLR